MPSGLDVLEKLEMLCHIIEEKSSIGEIANALGKSPQTVSNYFIKLTTAGIVFSVLGNGTKKDPRTYQIRISRMEAKRLLRIYFEEGVKREAMRAYTVKAKDYPLGIGISTWLFINHERAVSYTEWCDPWTKD